MRAAAAIAAMLILAGCTTTRTFTVAVPLSERIPSDLRTCAAKPGAPDPDTATQSDFVAWTARLRDAGANCRAKVGALDKLARS